MEDSPLNDFIGLSFFVPFYQKEGVFMYDNDEILINILDDDLFPTESEDDDDV